MAPEGRAKPAVVNLWGRRFPRDEIERTKFKTGDQVVILAGTNQRKTGIVLKIMPVMMLVKISEGPTAGEVIKCNQSNARRTGETEGKPAAVGEAQSLDLIIQTIDAMRIEYQDSMTQLTQQIRQMETEHNQKLEILTGMIQQVAQEHNE